MGTFCYTAKEKQQQSNSSGVDSDSSSNDSDGDSSEEEDCNSSRAVASGDSATPSKADSRTGTAAAAQLQQQYRLAHTKPRKGSKLQVLLQLRQLSGYDQRHSLQKDMLQAGVPLELADETKRCASNSCHELSDSSAMPIKLSSPEWTVVIQTVCFQRAFASETIEG